MEEKTLNETYPCGPWNDLVELIEVSTKRITEVQRHMYPYSERRKWLVFKDRNSELFSLLMLIGKLQSLISQKQANVSKQMIYTERDFVENVSFRLELLLRSELPEKAGQCYRRIEPLPQDEISAQTWHQGAVGTDADSLVETALGLISEMQPQDLVSRIFDQMTSVCDMINNPPEIEIEVKEEALRKEINQRTWAFKQALKKAQIDYVFDREPAGTINDLTNAENLEFVRTLRRAYEKEVSSNPKFGNVYKECKVSGLSNKQIALFLYHARDVQYVMSNLVLLIIAERKAKELEALIEEESQQGESQSDQTETPEPPEDHHATSPAEDDKVQTFKERLKEAYVKSLEAGASALCYLLAALCAHGDMKEDRPWLRDVKVRTVSDFIYWLSTMVDEFNPSEEDSKSHVKEINRYIKEKHGGMDYFDIIGPNMLELFVKNHYANPHETRTRNSIDLAGRIYNILDGLDD